MTSSTGKILAIVAAYVAGSSVWIFFSDRLLTGIDSRSELVELATLKGGLFVAITAVLLYFALQYFDRRPKLEPDLARPRFWTPIAVLLAVTATTAVVAHLAYRAEQDAMMVHIGEDLTTRVGAEARAVGLWHDDRRRMLIAVGRLVDRIGGAAGEPTDCRRIDEIAGLAERNRLGALAVGGGAVALRCAFGLSGRAEAVVERLVAGGEVGPGDFALFSDDGGDLRALVTTALPRPTEASPRFAAAVIEFPFDRDLAAPVVPSASGGETPTSLILVEEDKVWRIVHISGAGSVDPAAWTVRPAPGQTGLPRIERKGDDLLVRMAAIPGTSVAVANAISRDEAYGGIDHLAATTGVSLFVAFGASLFLAYVVWQRQWMRGALVELAQRRRAQRAEDLYRATFETVGVGIVHVSFPGRWIRVNPAFETMSGYSGARLADLPMLAVFAVDDRAGMRRSLDRLESGEIDRISADRRLLRADGSVLPVAITASVVRNEGAPFVVAAVEDLTPRVEAERALMRVEASKRLEALGRMTGGIAHDFNNLLTIISGNLQLLEANPASPKAGQFVAEALRAAEAGSRLNHRLTTFARQRRFAATRTDLAERIPAMLEVLRRTVGPTIRLTITPPEQPAVAWVDPTEVDNAVLNLVFNARDAMPNGGEIAIVIRNVSVDAAETVAPREAERGEFVEVVVSDTGIGMPPEVQARAFEPFFTTKASGRGTGLGLATLHGFVRQVGGTVTLDSEPGKGTRVTLRLPRAARGHPEAPADTRVPVAGAGERILVVEDDVDVARVTRERLLALGYDVVVTDGGRGALELIGDDRSIALVFSDIVMPGEIGGIELAERLIATSSTPVVLTSGHTFDSDRLDEIEAMGVRFLKKPYSQFELSVTLREALLGEAVAP